MKKFLFIYISVFVMFGCDSDGGNSSSEYFNGEIAPINVECTDIRFTHYSASNGGWCGFDRTIPILPSFVLNGMTAAIAEPWNGGSYMGEPGEACGECWEINTIYDSTIVMIHDLCPIEGNPVCSGWVFHFDLSGEANDFLGKDHVLASGSARRVPCPVTGNVFAQIKNWNQWGYVQLAFINHRIPVRSVEMKYASSDTWFQLTRQSGYFAALDGPSNTDDDLLYFRITSAQGEVIESTNSIQLLDDSIDYFDLGVQFVDQNAQTQVCEYEPVSDVYVDEWGGIHGVKWMSNPWGGTSVSETSSDCYNDSPSCIKARFPQWDGMHIYQWQDFPPDTFNTLTVNVKSQNTSPVNFIITPSGENGRCSEQEFEITDEWTTITVDMSVCNQNDFINTITFVNHSDDVTLLIDNLQFNH
jgi:expansin (peptidoglycan-binding protein)